MTANINPTRMTEQIEAKPIRGDPKGRDDETRYASIAGKVPRVTGSNKTSGIFRAEFLLYLFGS